MRVYQFLVRGVFGIVGVALMAVAVGLIVYAGLQLVTAFGAQTGNVGQALLDCVGYAVIAIAVFDVAKYILEEEVINPTEMRDTGQARRSNTKFISIISIAVFLEALVAIFQTSKGPDVSMMLYPTLLLLSGVAMLVGLGVYQRLSVTVESVVRSSPEAAADEKADLERF